jgi:hypothetical protein
MFQLLQRHRAVSKLNAKLQTNVYESLNLCHKFLHQVMLIEQQCKVEHGCENENH